MHGLVQNGGGTKLSAHFSPLNLVGHGCLKAALDEVICPHTCRYTANADGASALEDRPHPIIKLLGFFVADSFFDDRKCHVSRVQGSNNLGRALHAKVTNTNEEQ